MDEFRRRPVNRVQRPDTPVPARPPIEQQRPVAPTPFAPQQPEPTAQQGPSPTLQPIEAPQPQPKKRPSRYKKVILWSLVGLGVAIIALIGSVLSWYSAQLAPVDASQTDTISVLIDSGSTPSDIAATLYEADLIRNQAAFLWYARLSGTQNSLQAGTYLLAKSESTPDIIEHLVSGNVDTLTVTFLPGATVQDNKEALLETGFSAAEVNAAFAKTYESPLFEGKPASADLEGYIYGETYSFGADVSVEAILEHVFEYFYSVIDEKGLIAAYQAQGLSLYEGITLASIIQREASQAGDDMPQIAQVFYSRLALGMPLGSDVTYQYIADKTGVARDPGLDSPYNTRRYTGLPPGPIAAPGEKALLAAARPAEGDYLYFLSGDDDITYYARTLDEHNANIINHCQAKCQIL